VDFYSGGNAKANPEFINENQKEYSIPGLSVSTGIRETAYDLGIKYSQYFRCLFIKNVGCSPNEYTLRATEILSVVSVNTTF